MKVAIIGAGWAGIAAAVKLTEAGYNVHLFEAGRSLGGRARKLHSTHDTADDLDNGQHILLGAYQATLGLMHTLGVEIDQVLQRIPLCIQDNHGFRLALPPLGNPLNLAWGLLTARGVGFMEKIRTALWMQQLKTTKFQLPRDCSVTEWLDSVGQTGKLRHHLWDPLCLAALNTPPSQASARIFANVLRDSLASPLPGATDLLLPRTTLSALIPDPAHTWLSARSCEVRTRHRVKQLAQLSGHWNVDGEVFDKVIVAIAPQHLSALVPWQNPDLSFQPIGTVYLHYPEDTKLPFPLQALKGGIGQWVVDRGRGIWGASLSGAGAWETMSDPTLATQLQQELGHPAPLLRYRVIRDKQATFTCSPGLDRPKIITGDTGLFLAGDYTCPIYPATLEGAVISGLKAAQEVMSEN